MDFDRSSALTIYRGPVTKKEDSDNEDEDYGPISYSLPTLPRSPQKGKTESMEEEAPISYQDQMRQTGMMGIPPPPSDEGYWAM